MCLAGGGDWGLVHHRERAGRCDDGGPSGPPCCPHCGHSVRSPEAKEEAHLLHQPPEVRRCGQGGGVGWGWEVGMWGVRGTGGVQG